MSDLQLDHRYTGLEVAVIGMAGRFPLAEDTEQFWANLVEGVDAISRFSDEDLEEMGVPAALLADENYVRAKGILPHLESFDASFFHYTPADARLLDPQVRVLHEEVFHALEDAGYSSEERTESIGLFLGATNNLAWEAHTLSKYLASGPTFAGMQLNDKDFAATRIAYALNLRGPAMTMHTACSTSLVAIDLACRNLLTGGCQMAVAGGSGLTLPHKNGYPYQENMIHSSDGHCRAFDEEAEGTVEGNGVGVVVLKRLEAARRDGDRILAVIRSTATNNDGNRKVGYTAPSVEGQADVIRKAQRLAQVKPADISYVETHGTGTRLGDPIEVEALRKAFSVDALEPGSCGIGSLKSNIGHLDTAAGVASFIKTIQVLQNATVPPSLHFKTINSNIALDETPFRVVSELETLQRRPAGDDRQQPLRAGVSSFGIGGTNAHIVLEEAPVPPLSSGAGRRHNTLTLAAHSPEALTAAKSRLADHLGKRPELDPSDVAWTIQNRQRKLRYRYATDFADVADLRGRLEASLRRGEAAVDTGQNDRRGVYFLFSGLGAQHVRMARDLHATETQFRQRLEACFAEAAAVGRADLLDLFLGDGPEVEAELNNIETTQLMLFVLEVCMAQQLIEWGLRPTSMIGHSTGEFAAACVAGVFSVADGIKLIQARGNLMDQTPPGGMVTAKASEAVVRELLGEHLTLAAVNSPEDCSISGPKDALDAFEARCVEKNIPVTRLAAAHSYHSADMDVILPRFIEVLAGMTLNPPRIRYVSNVTGTWITPEQATDPEYYGTHLRSCVRFKDGIDTILADDDPVFVEVGPGKALSSFARHCGTSGRVTAVNMLRHRMEELEDDAHLAKAVRKLWEAGLTLDWRAFHAGRTPAKVALPLYPFDRTPYPIDIEEFQRHYGQGGDRAASSRPTQRLAERPAVVAPPVAGPQHAVWSSSVVSVDPAQETPRTVVALTSDPSALRGLLGGVPHWRSLVVQMGDRYTFRVHRGATVRKGHPEDLAQLVTDLGSRTLLGDTFLVHGGPDSGLDATLRSLAEALTRAPVDVPPALILLDDGPADRHDERLALLLGLNLEFPEARIASVGCDAPLARRDGQTAWRTALLAELGPKGTHDVAVRYERGRRLVPALQPLVGQAAAITVPQGSTLLLCRVDQLRTVAATLRGGAEGGTVRIQPYHVGPDVTVPELTGLPRNATVLPALTSRSADALASRLRARAVTLPLFDEVVVWDPAPTDPQDEGDLAARPTLHAAFMRLRPEPVPVNFLSPTGVALGAPWPASATAWLVGTVGTGRRAGGSRLFVHGRPENADVSCLASLQLMSRFGVAVGHLGADPLRMVGAGKVPVVATADDGDAVALQQVLAHEVGSLLGYDEVDPEADIFDLGLDSVRLVQFTSALERQGHRLLAADVYANPTLRSLAEHLLAQSGRTHAQGGSVEEVAAELTEAVGTECSGAVIEVDGADEPLVVLFVEGLDADVRARVVRALADLGVPMALQPHYILPRRHEAQFREQPDFAGLLAASNASTPETPALIREVERAQDELRASIAAQPTKWTYPISGMQRQHFRGEVRLQLYLIQFREVLDVPVLERAMCDVIGRHGLMRSFLTRRLGQFQWREFEAPMEIVLPQLDVSGLEPGRQDEAAAALVKHEWSMDFKVVDKPMYQMFLLKYNEKRHDLVFQFDHSIFDVTSGQLLRGDLIRRYRELLGGSVRAMPVAKSYRHLQDQINKGPVNITPDEIIEKFELDRYVHYTKLLRQRAAHHAGRPIEQTRYSVRLDHLREGDDGELELFSLVTHLYARLVARLVGVDHVPCDILFQSRVFEDKDYSEVMGMLLGGLPFVIPADRDKRGGMRALIREKVDMMNRNNVSFLNLIHDARSFLRYRKVFAATKEVMGRTFRTSCLLNFVGVVEDEYDAIWDMTLEQLDDEQAKLDYADCYCVAKISGDQLDLLVLTRWGDSQTVSALLDDEVSKLAGPVPAISRATP